MTQGLRGTMKTRVLTDLTSQTLLCHVSFLLEHFVPRSLVMRWLEQQRRSLAETFRYPDSCLMPVGSFRDGLNRPNVVLREANLGRDDVTERVSQYDADLLYTIDIKVGTTDEEADYTIDTSESYPGYFQIAPKRQSDANVGIEELFNSLKQQYAKRNWSQDDVGRQGPSLAFKDQTADIDMVPMGTCVSWPQAARRWQNRMTFSGWPPMSLREDLVSSACHFVFKAHSSSKKPVTECRFSFVIAELVLTSKLSKSQRQCYIIFKVLVKYLLQEGSVISSYCLKTTLFWAMEMIPQMVWDDPIHGLGECFFEMLDMLIKFLVEGHLPQYFIPENNLIGHLDRQDIRTVLRKLLSLRRNPVAVLFEYNSKFRCCNETRNLGVIPSMLPKTADNYKLTASPLTGSTAVCLQLQQKDSLSYFMHTVRAESISCALIALKDLVDFSITCGSDKLDAVDFILSQIPRYTGRERDFLAKLCIITSLQSSDHTSNKKRVGQVKATLKQMRSMSFELGVYLVLYYVACSDDHEANITLNTLSMLLQKHRKKTLPQSYFEELVPYLDDVMKLLYLETGKPQISLGSIIYYQMVTLYTRIPPAFLAEEVALEFEDYAKSEPERTKKCCYFLLAFALMHIKQYWRAALAFEEIISSRREEVASVVSREDLDTVIWIYRSRADLCKAMTLYQLYSHTE